MVLILRLVLLFYFKLLFLLFKGSFIGKKNAEIIENVGNTGCQTPGTKDCMSTGESLYFLSFRKREHVSDT